MTKIRIPDNRALWSILRQFCFALPFVMVAAPMVQAKIIKQQPTLATTICYGFVTATGVASNPSLAAQLARQNWSRKVRGIHSVRFANWNKARLRGTTRRRDRIEQNWVVTRRGRPCGPRFLAKG